jgi:hypothetical protein
MKIHAKYCSEGEEPGDYKFLARPPNPPRGAVRIADPPTVEWWAAGFQRWIAETREHIRRAEEGRPGSLDWGAPVTVMRAHLALLESERRTADRPYLFRFPL